jgi:predicted neuraminidase
MGLRMRDGSLLLVFNNTGKKRYRLSLARSVDEGKTWSVIHDFDRYDPGAVEWPCEYSYPFIIQTRDGLLHLVYTWHRLAIKHIVFNEAWLKGLKGEEAQ